MGKNNRARRQQKQRKKAAQRSSGALRAAADWHLIEDVGHLCEVASLACDCGELPPPHLMQIFSAPESDARLRRFKEFLQGFLYYLYLNQPPAADQAWFDQERAVLKKAAPGWFFHVLQCYNLLGDPNLSYGNTASLASYLDSAEAIPPSVPLQLIADIVSKTKLTQSQIALSLEVWLFPRELYAVRKPLQKFLALQSPKPKTKTAEALDSALAAVAWSSSNFPSGPVWQNAIGQLLHIVLSVRGVSSQAAAWETRPAIQQLLASEIKMPEAAVIPAGDQGSHTLLGQWLNALDLPGLPYALRLKLELVHFRIIAGQDMSVEAPLAHRNVVSHLEKVIMQCCSGVVEEQQETAKICLTQLGAWLAGQVVAQNLAFKSLQCCRRPTHLLPKDYRYALFYFGATGKEPSQTIGFQNVDAALFVAAFKHCSLTTPALLRSCVQHFYLPLGWEAQKELALFACRDLLLRNSAQLVTHSQAQIWSELSGHLFSLDLNIVRQALQGSPCETEWLFYCALTCAGKPNAGDGWINKQNIDAVLRHAGSIQQHNRSSLFEQHLLALLLTLTQKGATDYLIESMGVLQSVLDNISWQKPLETLHQHLLAALHRRDDKNAPVYQAYYRLCSQHKTLRALIPRAVPAKKARPPVKRKTRDLFGD